MRYYSRLLNLSLWEGLTRRHFNKPSSFLQNQLFARSVGTMEYRGSDRIKDQKESVWVEFIQLALEENPLNLGQGFPDFAAPTVVTDALAETTSGPNVLLNQYTRGFGHPRLVKAISKLYSNLCGREIDSQTEVLVTAGAYEGLYCATQGLINPGEEAIIIEPFFDCYAPMVEMAGGVPVFIPLRPQKTGCPISSREWVLDPKELESKFNEKTRIIIVNTPHNPVGKIFTYQELEMIGNLCKKYNTIAIMDEVYEWIVFKGNEHIRMATLPGMWERTLTIGSAGKTFSVTGWKIGWVYGPPNLIRPLQMLHQNCIYTCSTPVQEAIALGFETEMEKIGKPDSYWRELADTCEVKRDQMSKFLINAGMNPTIPDAGYFMLADYTGLTKGIDYSGERGKTNDHKFVRWLSKNKKLQGIPPSAFYSDEHKKLAEDFIRFCFMKKDETLNEAEKIISEMKK